MYYGTEINILVKVIVSLRKIRIINNIPGPSASSLAA
jgi:hypothetical protein